MAEPNSIEPGNGEQLPILHEDRSVLAIDKPPGWMLVPFSWQKTNQNLQAAITSSVAERSFWARSRNLKFLRFVHRLGVETSGILLFAESPGAVNTFGGLFESRQMEKLYLAIAHGIPQEREWTCRLKLTPKPNAIGAIKVDSRVGKEVETHFRVFDQREASPGKVVSLIKARPITGRTHQIRVHLWPSQDMPWWATRCMANLRPKRSPRGSFRWGCGRSAWLTPIRSPDGASASPRRGLNSWKPTALTPVGKL